MRARSTSAAPWSRVDPSMVLTACRVTLLASFFSQSFGGLFPQRFGQFLKQGPHETFGTTTTLFVLPLLHRKGCQTTPPCLRVGDDAHVAAVFILGTHGEETK